MRVLFHILLPLIADPLKRGEVVPFMKVLHIMQKKIKTVISRGTKGEGMASTQLCY